MKRVNITVIMLSVICLLTVALISCGKAEDETKAAETLPPIYTGSETADNGDVGEIIQIFGKTKCFDTKKAERWFKERRIK